MMTISRPTGETTPAGVAVTQSTALKEVRGRFRSLLETAEQEILAVTYWFEPTQRPEPYPVTVRFVGRRAGVVGKYQPGDQFVHDETIAAVTPGSGPISVTVRIHDVNSGEWLVTAHELGAGGARATRGERRRRQAYTLTAVEPRGLVARFWRRWAPSAAPTEASTTPIRTSAAPFAHVPGTLPFIWMSLVTLGIALALLLQSFVMSRAHLAVQPVWTVSLAAIGVGIVGAKAWYIAKHWSERRIDGWCIQGFIAGAIITAAILLAGLRVPVSIYLDATAPGLLLGLAVGRVGCFFAGCCGGPPTAARWGVWSSDQRIGARRVPTQLLESALALGLGVVALAVVVGHHPGSGAHFVAALAAYTLGRQGVLWLRAEPNRTQWALPATALVSGLILVLAVGAIALA
jgi:phosphatidylglycerol---prolipoprotein diacylglyceryl transferase